MAISSLLLPETSYITYNITGITNYINNFNKNQNWHIFMSTILFPSRIFFVTLGNNSQSSHVRGTVTL